MTSAALLLCLVVGVSDGDTLTARCGEPGAYQQVKVRVAEIDAPERRQPFGDRSRQSLADLCFQRSAVLRVTDRDRYGRTVARVECAGTDASLHQVSTGMAWWYRKYSRDPQLKKAEQSARTAGLGLWSQPGADAPWGWRREQSSLRNFEKPKFLGAQ